MVECVDSGVNGLKRPKIELDMLKYMYCTRRSRGRKVGSEQKKLYKCI